DPIRGAWFEAAKAAGFPFNPDTSSGNSEGFGPTQYTVRNGYRSSAAAAYLKPALTRPNLTVQTHAYARRIIVDGNKAVGIEYQNRNGDLIKAEAAREVLLCGGVYNSPHLLMLSGIGPADHLREHQIQVIADLPV